MSTRNYAEMELKELVNLAKERKIKGASKMTKAVLIAALNNSETTENRAENSQYAVNAMRTAIISAHKLCNKSAITKDDAIKGGTTEERFEQWIQWVKDLRDVAAAYVVLKHSNTATKQEKDIARGKIFPAWRSILAVGEENVFHKNMFVTEHDVDSIVGYAETFVATVKGSAQSVQSPILFRKKIETLLGCRIAGNAVLNDEQRDTLAEFYGAQRTLKNATNRLNGTEDKDGKHIPGILDTIKALTKELDDMKTLLTGFGISEEEIAKNATIANMRTRLDELKEEQKTVESSKKKAEETIARLGAKAKEIEDSLNPIEE